MPDYKFAEIAYDAYCRKTGGVSLISGEKLPDFWSLKPAIMEAWDAAAHAVLEAAGGQEPEVRDA